MLAREVLVTKQGALSLGLLLTQVTSHRAGGFTQNEWQTAKVTVRS